jgi:hypothetical protein
MEDPGPIPFRRETVEEARKYMADKIREFEIEFREGSGEEGGTNSQ